MDDNATDRLSHSSQPAKRFLLRTQPSYGQNKANSIA